MQSLLETAVLSCVCLQLSDQIKPEQLIETLMQELCLGL